MAQTNIRNTHETPINWLQIGIALVLALGICAGSYFWLMHG